MNGAFRLGVVAAATARADEPGPGPGAGPEWLSVTRTTGQSSATQIVSMPASVAAGDLLLMIVALGNDTTFASGTPPSGWTLVGGVGQSGTSRVYVLYRIASGTEGGTTLNIGISKVTLSIFEIHRIKNGTFHAAGPITVAPYNTGTSALINYPSLAPLWGEVPILWFSAAVFQGRFGGSTVTGYPFANGQLTTPGADTSALALLATSRELITAESQDPGQASTINTSRSWAATVVAVRPS